MINLNLKLKVPGPISQNEDFCSNDVSSPNKFQLNWLNRLDTRKDYVFCNNRPILVPNYCVSIIIMFTIIVITITIFIISSKRFIFQV